MANVLLQSNVMDLAVVFPYVVSTLCFVVALLGFMQRGPAAFGRWAWVEW